MVSEYTGFFGKLLLFEGQLQFFAKTGIFYLEILLDFFYTKLPYYN